jgi:hypothetical protein
LHGRQVPRTSHCKPRADPGNRVVRAEEDQEDADANSGRPRGRTSEAVREEQDRQGDQPDQRELDDVESSEPRRLVHHRLRVLFRLRMNDLERGERERRREEQHAPRRRGESPHSVARGGGMLDFTV